MAFPRLQPSVRMGLVVAIVSIFVLAGAAPGLQRCLGQRTGWGLALLPAALTGYFATLVESVAAGESLRVEVAWVPSLGVALSLRLDGLALLFAVLICGVGALVLIYSAGYLGAEPRVGRFYASLLLFMGAMLGLVLADNVYALFVFWELTSVASFLLIGHDQTRAEARAAARQALLVTGGGGLALLVGLILLTFAGGSPELSDLAARSAPVREHGWYGPILVLVLLGAATKSAQVPFHFWLPGAMAAPTPVSAYLHSATMVKAGVYLLARLHPVLAGTAAWHGSVTTIGAVTMVSAGVLAVLATDLKQILAYSTVSALGTLVMLLGLGSSEAATAAVVVLLAHALYKGALFMVAGAIDFETGTRDIRDLGGLGWAMPMTALAAGLAGLALAGLGPFLSFIGKEALLDVVWESSSGGGLLVGAAVLTGGLSVTVAAMVVGGPFLGALRPAGVAVQEAPASLWLGPLCLAILGLVVGIWSQPVADGIVAPAAAAIVGTPTSVKLALWHGVNPALILSGLSLMLGLAVYAGRGALGRLLAGGAGLLRVGPAAGYDLGLRGVEWLAQTSTHVVQSGYLRYYTLTILTVTVGLVGYALVGRAGLVSPGEWRDITFYEAGLLGVTVLAALLAVLVRSYLTAIAALGVIGYTVAVLFVMFGAPDLAMTQFLVETLTLILFLQVFARRRQTGDLSPSPARLRDAILAGAFGVLMAAWVLVASRTQFEPTISRYYSENSLPLAHGRNVVNVILVDFRGLDTLGEVTVLAAAGIGVYALLKLRPRRQEETRGTASLPEEKQL